MKSIEVSDEAYAVLEALASQRGLPSVAALIETLPEVRDDRRKRNEHRFLEVIESTHFAGLSLKDRFLSAVKMVHEINPEAFRQLDGLTKSQGSAIFISRSSEAITRTSASARPEPIGDSGFFLNVHGSHLDFQRLIEVVCREVGLSATFANAIKGKLVSPSLDPKFLDLLKKY